MWVINLKLWWASPKKKKIFCDFLLLPWFFVKVDKFLSVVYAIKWLFTDAILQYVVVLLYSYADKSFKTGLIIQPRFCWKGNTLFGYRSWSDSQMSSRRFHSVVTFWFGLKRVKSCHATEPDLNRWHPLMCECTVKVEKERIWSAGGRKNKKCFVRVGHVCRGWKFHGQRMLPNPPPNSILLLFLTLSAGIPLHAREISSCLPMSGSDMGHRTIVL